MELELWAVVHHDADRDFAGLCLHEPRLHGEDEKVVKHGIANCARDSFTCADTARQDCLIARAESWLPKAGPSVCEPIQIEWDSMPQGTTDSLPERGHSPGGQAWNLLSLVGEP
jgi:hypothetical protein